MDNKKAKKHRCYLYLRVSTEIQVEGYSLDAQYERLIREANYRDMQVVEEFRDEGKSGKNVSGRPAFQEMLRRIQDKTDDVDYVLVFKLSRFGRNTADVLNNLQIMQDYGVNLLSVEEGIDSAGAAGKLMISVIAAVAEIERDNIQSQTMAGRMQKAREGRWNGGQAPYGYKIDKECGVLVLDEEEAEIIRLIYDRYLNYSQGANGVAKWLNNTGYRKNTRQNGKYILFSAHFIKGVLDNPVYCGKIAYGRRRNEKIDGTRNEFHVIKQSSYETFCGKHEAIIDQDTWDAVQRKRSKTSVKHEKTHSLEHEHILSGILKCPICGASMYGSVNRKRKKDGTHYKDIFYYVCKHRKMVDGQSCTYGRQVNQDIVNKEIEAIMSEAMQSSTFSEAMQEIMNEKTDENRLREQMEALQRSRIQYVGAKDKLSSQIDSLDVTDRAYNAKYADMQKRLDKLYDEIMTVDAQIAEVEQDMRRQLEARATIDSAYNMLSFFGEAFPRITDAEKKEIINAWVDCVEIYPDRKDDGRWVRAVRFKFPVVLDGEICTEWLHKRNHDETVVLLSR